ncbi:MAG: gliding motility-associated ABC transporter substrate-binding protein GldG [Prevotellaceae bacterium]|jgi:ABC-2 type transport system permease protein|nr:gliding motility-associated ABC transporter substrate-binding protein GldG [Prevotellaceae bacterium]
MWVIFVKEVRAFFSSLTGYLALVVFLLMNAWFLWLGPGEFNVLDNGYADLNALFTLAPWIFLFLIPAVTMRSFAEEKKSGTLELLLTKPITPTQLITGKYAAAVVLALCALLPTLVHVYSIYVIGNPVGNMDMGGTWGSYLGLCFLAAIYAAIGIFASSVTANQITAYIVAAALCFFFYTGFDGLSQLNLFASAGHFILQSGINEHYKSISRGVVDSRDVLYFLSAIAAFLSITRLALRHKKWKSGLRTGGFIAVLIVLNIVMQHTFFRIDLTADKRYTLSDISKKTAKNLKTSFYVELFLTGDIPVQMKKLQATIKETLDELKVYAGNRIQYKFIDVEAETGSDAQALNHVYASLQDHGLVPFIMQEHTGGRSTERVLFPGALISCAVTVADGDSTYLESREIAVNFIQQDAQTNPEANILLAQENAEYELINAISLMSREEQRLIAFVEGHGELSEYETGDICKALAGFSHIDRINILGRVGVLDKYDLVIVAKPMQAWNEADKLALDQYIMQGGRTAWFIDAAQVHHDSLANGHYTFALPCPHRLDDQLFKYGVRLNPDVIQDLQCSFLPVNIAPAGQTSNFKPAPWTYYPLLAPPASNDITRGLNLVKSEYPGSIDTVNRHSGVHKTVLLHTSQYSRAQTVPLRISQANIDRQASPEQYSQSYIPVAILMEGVFPSAFQYRAHEHYNDGKPFTFAEKSEPTKMIVVADGDIIRNEVIYRAGDTRIVPLGFDRYTGVQFGNKNLVKNMLLYLLDDGETMQARRREFTLRLLDKREIAIHRTYWIMLNTILPIGLVLLSGGVFLYRRKRKYTSRILNSEF